MIAVFYYTQSGQALDIAHNICCPIERSGVNVVYKNISPQIKFPYPWDKKSFFDIFPETRLGLPPCGIQPIDFSDIEDAELVIVCGQSWFLSPSVPIQAFFGDENTKAYLKGRNVIFINGCRNMWLNTFRRVQEYVADADAKLVGHIVLQDRNPNLVSVVTIIRWMMYGKKSATRLLPQAGVSDADIRASYTFGEIIRDHLPALADGECLTLQQRLVERGAIHYKPGVLFLERNGHRIFKFWAKFIRKKGEYGDKGREARCNLFYIYLLFVLYVISPLGMLFFKITLPFRNIKAQKAIDCSV